LANLAIDAKTQNISNPRCKVKRVVNSIKPRDLALPPPPHKAINENTEVKLELGECGGECHTNVIQEGIFQDIQVLKPTT
jgi:hypothetical protein